MEKLLSSTIVKIMKNQNQIIIYQKIRRRKIIIDLENKKPIRIQNGKSRDYDNITSEILKK